jgi:O-antigen/teichoic acid export membrane protein
VIAYKASADAASKAATLFVMIAAARALPAPEFGVLALAMTTGWLLSVASDAGLPLDLSKQIAQAVADGTRPPFALVRDTMRLRLALAAGAAVAGAAAGAALVPRSWLLAFVLVVLAQLLNATLETLAHAFRGLGRSEVDASVSLVQRSLGAGAACTVLALWPSLLWVGVALMVPPAIALVVSLIVAWRLTAHDASGTRPKPLRARFAREIAPVGIAMVLSALYFRCDVYFVSRWHGLETVGMYNAAFRIVEALRLVPAAVMAVMFPAFCRSRGWSPLAGVLWALGSAAVVVAAIVYMGAAPLMTVIYGGPFGAAAPALQLLALSVPLFFVNYALTHQVIAWDGQRAYLRITAAALAANIGANLLLIPTGGMRGAAIATLLTEVVVAAGCGWALVRGLPDRRGARTRRRTVALDVPKASEEGL